jgi:cobalt-zinc-cadmium efflux system protein
MTSVGHGHGHRGHHAHLQGRGGARLAANRRLLVAALALVCALMAGEVAAGLVAGSLALLADAGHLLTDATALGLAAVAAAFAARPPRGRFTFGFLRAEILAAQANGIVLVLLGVWILVEGARRLADPREVEAELVGWVALAGVAVSGCVALLLARAQGESLNVRGAYLHVVTDVAAFAGTGIAALLIIATGWNGFDPLVSLGVAALLLWAAYGLLRESGRIFLEAAPVGAPPAEVGEAIASHPGVVDAHDLHVWEVTSGFPALSAHVLVEPGGDCHRIRLELERMLHERFGIDHTTLQVEHVGTASGLAIRRSAEQP